MLYVLVPGDAGIQRTDNIYTSRCTCTWICGIQRIFYLCTFYLCTHSLLIPYMLYLTQLVCTNKHNEYGEQVCHVACAI